MLTEHQTLSSLQRKLLRRRYWYRSNSGIFVNDLHRSAVKSHRMNHLDWMIVPQLILPPFPTEILSATPHDAAGWGSRARCFSRQ